MAESIVSDVVVKLLEYMGKSAFQEIAPYFGGKRKLKELEQTMEMIQARLLDAERRGEGEGDGEQVIKKWLQRLKLILFCLEDLLKEITVANKVADRATACSLHELAGKILTSISGGEYHQLSLEQIQSQLRQGSDGKRYLLVFDDLWDEDRKRWLELRSFLHGGKQGSKIIVTSRSKVVARNMGTVEPFELKGLKDDKSWDLFEKLAFQENQEARNPNLTRIGKEIIKKCANVPLAVKTIACLLYSMDTESGWETFKDKELRTIEQNENSILLTLKLSYGRLPSQLKQCFAHCSLFPKDHLFVKQDLIYLWMAQGFLRPTDGQSPEDVGHRYIMQLKRRCFFHDAVKNYYIEVVNYSMHDLAHNLAQLVAGGETLLVDEPYQQQINDNICHVSFCSPLEETPSWLLATKQMRSFLHLHTVTRLKFAELFPSLRCLHVLSLAEFKIIPDSLGELKHLRYLKLGGRRECLPECITKLQNLQTLDLGDC